jgi:hypothetical protein
MLHALFISARPAILPSNSRMISDEIRQRFAGITLILNPSAFIFGIALLVAFYAIARVLRGEPRPGAYADSGRDLRRPAMRRPDPQRVFRSRSLEASQTELSKHKSNDKKFGRVRKIFTQWDGASMLDPSAKIRSGYPG